VEKEQFLFIIMHEEQSYFKLKVNKIFTKFLNLTIKVLTFIWTCSH